MTRSMIFTVAAAACTPQDPGSQSTPQPQPAPEWYAEGTSDDLPLVVDPDPTDDTDSQPADPVRIDGMPRIHLDRGEGCAVGRSGLITCWGGDEHKNPYADHLAYTPFVTEDVPDDEVASVVINQKGVGFGSGGGIAVAWGDNFAGGEAWLEMLGDGRSWSQADTGGGVWDWCSVASDGSGYCTGVDLPGGGWTWASAGWDLSACAIHRTEGLQCWEGPRANGLSRFGALPIEHPDARAVDIGNWCTCVITHDRGVACDGYQCAAQPPPGLEGVRRLVVDAAYACAIDDDDQLSCWGAGHFPPPPPRALEVRARDVWVSIDVACLIAQDDELICWGSDGYGQASPPAYAR